MNTEKVVGTMSPILISHDLAHIGKLDITLHGIAAQFYNQLQAAQIIDYLKGMDHLGYLAKSHPGNHHKRWDYVCLQLYFLQKLKHSTFNTGLNSPTKLDGAEVSNQEILQTFILFSNIGHLEGTLASEKGLFDFLVKNTESRDLFLRKVNTESELKAFAKKIFETYDVYKIKYLVALNYILQNNTETRIISAIRLILRKYLSEDSESFEKLKILYFKIRKVSFLYLDSLHCQMPVQVNLSKILVNIFNYDLLFNPVDQDYDTIFDSCETVLSKELYLSPKASLTYCTSAKKFHDFLEETNHGPQKIDYSNLLLSLVNGGKGRFVTDFPKWDNHHIFQFFLAKDAWKIFEISFDSDFESSLVRLHKNEKIFNDILNEGFGLRCNQIVVQHDMRKSLIFFTVLIDKSASHQELGSILKNFNKLFCKILAVLDPKLFEPGFERFTILLSKNFQKDIIRRYFLYLLKLFFEKKERLNLYIKFQYRQLITTINSTSPVNRIYETSFAATKKRLLAELRESLSKQLPTDIRNNIHVMIKIVKSHIRVNKNVNFFYSIFPIEIEKMVYSAYELDKSGNAEIRTIVTDIDALLIAFTKESYELFLIEGKKHKNRFKKLCTGDLNKIKSMSGNSSLFSDPVTVVDGLHKGGFIKIEMLG